MSDSVRPHRWQPTRLPHPWDSPGKNTGVGCHLLLQCIKVKSESEVAQATSSSWHFQGLLQAHPPFLTLFSPSGDSTFLQLWAFQFSSVQFSRSVMSDSLQPHESQHARPPCPSPSPGVHSDSHPSSRWCHPAISSSVVPFSSSSQSLPASKTFPMSQLFAWGGQSTGVSASASFLPKKFQGWSASEWTGWISLQSKELSRARKGRGRNN